MGEEEEEELEEVEFNENISQQEVLARKFEEWQKSFLDDVYSLYARNDEKRGEIAFENWKNRFLRFLAEKLPGKDLEYNQYLSKSIKGKYFNVSPLYHFKDSQGGTTEAFLTQCIEDARKGYLDEHLSPLTLRNDNRPQQEKANHIPSIFISHSSIDANLANLILELLRFALNISSKEIRCTSVDGYRLSGGADVEDTLKTEVLNTDILIGLISEKSFDSAYVLFELGARWGTGKKLIPLLASGIEANKLKGPIIGYNALSCKSNSQLHQLVENIAESLNLEVENPSSYQNKIDAIIEYSKTND